MERDLWGVIVTALGSVPPTRPRNAVFTDRDILAVLLWAALHDRPVSWACRRRSWPVQAWRRTLPHQSTVSRRMRCRSLMATLEALLHRVQRALRGEASVMAVDGKPLTIGRHSRDPDARHGWAIDGHARGYKLHVVLDDLDRVVDWAVTPLNAAEPLVARHLLRRACREGRLPRGLPVLGDRAYDSNPLHMQASICGVQLIAPRKRAGTGLGRRRHHRSRVRCARAMESAGSERVDRLYAGRTRIERFFGTLVSAGGGLAGLAPWVRRWHRCRLWVGCKLVINAARTVLRRRQLA